MSARSFPPTPVWLKEGYEHIWMPYTQMRTAPPPQAAVATEGARILLADARHLIDGAVLEALGPQGILVNVARGLVVDEADVVWRALRRFKQAGGDLADALVAALAHRDRVEGRAHTGRGEAQGAYQ